MRFCRCVFAHRRRRCLFESLRFRLSTKALRLQESPFCIDSGFFIFYAFLMKKISVFNRISVDDRRKPTNQKALTKRQ